MIENLINIFAQKKHKRTKGRSLHTKAFSQFGKVKKMARVSESEARQRAVELLELILNFHEETGIADFVTDTQVLKSIREMLVNSEVEERDIKKTKVNLYKVYAKHLRDEILQFVELSSDTYINFEDTSVVLNRAEETIENELAREPEIRNVVLEMNTEYKRLRQSEELLENKGRNNFFIKMIELLGLELVLFGGVSYFKIASASTALQYLISVAIVTYFIFREIYKMYLIVGSPTIFRNREYYEQ